MGGSWIEGDWDDLTIQNNHPTSTSTTTRTVVLIGRTGNGKSATANSILGVKAFKSRSSSSGVTSTTELRSTVFDDRSKVINVIDTPGLFDVNIGSETMGKEIVKCIELARDGIHAVLLVFSVHSRFSQEEESVIESLQTLFGPKITDYMIVVFTGGDELEDNDETIEEYIGRECPQPLQKILEACGRCYVIFDKKTKDETKKAEQFMSLMDLIDVVVEASGGQAFTNNVFLELKKEATKLNDSQAENDSPEESHIKVEMTELKEQMQKSYEKQPQANS